MKCLGSILAAVLVCAPDAQAVSFTNLDFESASLPEMPPETGGFVASSAGLPGWNVFIGSQQTDVVLHNAHSLGTPVVNIFGPSDSASVLEGRYSAGFYAGFDGGSMSPVPVSISQVGTVPSDAKSLRFLVWNPQGWGELSWRFGVTANGEPLTLVALSSGSPTAVYGADVSEFANEETTLRFTAIHPFVLLDTIAFSADPVPEPAPLVLLGLGLAVAALWHQRRSRGHQAKA